MKIRAVLVDDEPLGLEMSRLALEGIDPELELVGAFLSPQDLLDSWEKLRAELVVTDIRMPGMDGLQLIREIQSRTTERRVWFVLLSAYSQLNYAREAMSLGVRYYLAKPFLRQDAQGIVTPLCREIRAWHEQEEQAARINEVILSQYSLSVIHAGAPAPELECASFSGVCCACIAGLFDSAVHGCGEDVARMDRLLRDNRHCVIMTREPAGIEFLCHAESAEAHRREMARLAEALDAEGLEHPYYLAVGTLVDQLRNLNESYVRARSIAAQAPYRDDCRMMRAFLPSQPISEDQEARESVIQAAAQGAEKDALAAIDRLFAAWQRAQTPFPVIQNELDTLVFRGLKLLGEENSDDLFDFYRKNVHTLERLHITETRRRFAEFCTRLCRLLNEQRRRVKNLEDPAQRVADYIEAHYDEDVTVQSIAAALSFHPAYIGTAFKKQRDTTIHQYLHEVRIGHAVKRMQTTGDCLTDIALDVGYNSYSAFVSAFERVMGSSPYQFRRNTDER